MKQWLETRAVLDFLAAAGAAGKRAALATVVRGPGDPAKPLRTLDPS